MSKKSLGFILRSFPIEHMVASVTDRTEDISHEGGYLKNLMFLGEVFLVWYVNIIISETEL